MDVVESELDWKTICSSSAQEGGDSLGRGTSDMKRRRRHDHGLGELMSEGFMDCDIIFFYSGDEETRGVGATLGSTKWRDLTDAEFGLNADGGCPSFDEQFRALGCGISMAEKTFQTYFYYRIWWHRVRGLTTQFTISLTR